MRFAVGKGFSGGFVKEITSPEGTRVREAGLTLLHQVAEIKDDAEVGQRS